MTIDFLAVFRPAGADVVTKLLARIEGRRHQLAHRPGLLGLLTVDPDLGTVRHANVNQSGVLRDVHARSRRGLAITRHTVIGGIIGAVVIRVIIIVPARAVVRVAAAKSSIGVVSISIAAISVAAAPSAATPSAATPSAAAPSAATMTFPAAVMFATAAFAA